MNNEEKLIKTLLAGVSEERNDIKIASLLAIGESGIIDEGLLVAALEKGTQSARVDVRIAAYTAMGRMLRNSNRQ
ncbi:hypothetical protein [Aeromonas salmonicida]|uniref:hypothetical protein n=1 Tax=Aeromonas salmonicida TaxID=645 RepID=UPI00259F0340|nr:hypothetical protein [Aeromonas salmonicida]MDM5100335.1 hypothetical protein [Aeromonas salmonicida]